MFLALADVDMCREVLQHPLRPGSPARRPGAGVRAPTPASARAPGLRCLVVDLEPGILARGPWAPEQLFVRWTDEQYEPRAATANAADAAIAALSDRGSPAHDGLAARLSGFRTDDRGLVLELQPVRWALRLVAGDAATSLSVLCAVRSHDGRWLAGRRADWVASWAGKWALGAGGAVEIGENPAETLVRELQEEWSVVPERFQVEALVVSADRLAMLIGQAWLPEGAEVVRDPEHDEHAWWPADPAAWPEHADPVLRHMGALISA
jgi:ADP-ribose pyrophosphatase YjhB (NUDIX family)